MILAHLNGGPLDDQCWAVEWEVVVVAMQRRLLRDSQTVMTSPTIRHGLYRLRIDGNGDPVPHNLEGAIEYDFDMASLS